MKAFDRRRQRKKIAQDPGNDTVVSSLDFLLLQILQTNLLSLAKTQEKNNLARKKTFRI